MKKKKQKHSIKHRALDDLDDNAAIKQPAVSDTASIYDSTDSRNRYQRCIYGTRSHKHIDKANI